MSTYNSLVYRASALIVLLWTVCVGGARADSATDALDQISKCSAIADSAERLKCFDRAAPVAKEAQTPKPADFGRPTPPRREVSEVVATVRELSRTVRGQAVFFLDNGQVWAQLDGDDSAVRDWEAGRKVSIQRGLLDSFNMTIEGRKGLVKVRRIE